ncbi:MAG: MBL fold metallo-hydrolase [Acidobacteriia bacterium]|nr:MBL fold metallo-hydrolase [Terriglobia bacterium]
MLTLASHRRDFLRALLAAPAGLTLSFTASGQNAAPIKGSKLSANLALVTGDGGNIAIVISKDGLLMVDSGLAERSGDLLSAVNEQVDAHRITLVFNTHWHLDHVGANELLGRAGSKIMAHENVKKRLSQKIVMEALNRTVEPLKPEGLPTRTFNGAGQLNFGTQKIQYASVPPAHTDGDAWLFFPGPNVLHTGDLLFNGGYPFIDDSTGGWIGGMVAAADAMLLTVDARTRIIPGHGPLATPDDLRASRDMLATVHERLAAMARQGKTVDEAVAAAPTKDLDAKWGAGFLKGENFTRIAYTGLLRHK